MELVHLRRAVQVSRKRPDVIVKPIRGNIETRIKKVSGENYDAIVLAQAGISRLGVDVKYTPLSVDDFSPSPGQGAIAIVARADDVETISMLKKIEDADSRLEIEAERSLSDYVDSGCRFPLGAYAKSNGSEMTLSCICILCRWEAISSCYQNWEERRSFGLLEKVLEKNFVRKE